MKMLRRRTALAAPSEGCSTANPNTPVQLQREDVVTMLKRMTTCIKFTGCLCTAALFPVSLAASSPVVVADRARDEFLTG